MTKEEKAAYKREWARRNAHKRRAKWAANSDAINAKRRETYRASPEKIKARVRSYHHVNRAKLVPAMRDKYLANKPRHLAKCKAWRLANIERCLENQKAYYRRNKGRHLQTCRAWAVANPHRIRAIKKKWQMTHPERAAMNKAVRRARLQNAFTGDVKDIAAFYRAAYRSEHVVCAYCGTDIPKGKRHVDHATPLSRNGLHCCTNLAVACAGCNLEKGTKTAEEYHRYRQSVAA